MIFALVILLVSAPSFYFITQWIYISDTNETLLLSKKEFYKYSLSNLKISDIELWNKMNWNIKIQNHNPAITNDTIYNLQFPDPVEMEDQPYRVLLTPIQIENQPYTLLVRMNMIESEGLVESIALVFLGIIVLLFVGLYFITKRLSIRLWKPFYESLRQIEKFKIDKNDSPVWMETDIAEFSRLNQAVDVLITQNMVIYKSQQEFIENAAHELQTPLAVFQAKLDALMQTGKVSKEQSEIIEFLNTSVARLNRLNKNLLILSKLDHNQYNAIEILSLLTLLQKHIDFFIIQSKSKNISFNVNIENELEINANPGLVDILLSNLLLNAIRHNEKNGSIEVKLKGNSLRFSNTGQPEPLDEMKIFQRFSKLNPSSQGSGLGLAIVKKIADHYNWRLNYSMRKNFHVFELVF
jgi:two-component system sensor histidine kinase ArlS